jgi:hypothetical protein
MPVAKILLATLAFLLSQQSIAADVRAAQENKIIIEGTLVDGDYERFVKTAENLDVAEVAIYSNGGSVAQAIAIGKLIRELRLHTVAPRGFGASGNVCPGIHDQSNCTCLSACVLVFVAGINRYGNVLGVHRSYIEHSVLKNMGGTDAVSASRKLLEAVGTYLASMGVPRSIIDRMNATSSQEISYLSNEEIDRFLSGYLPEYGELIIAKCGDVAKVYAKLRALDRKKASAGFSPQEQSEYDHLLEQGFRTMPRCESRVNAELRHEVFWDAMTKALSYRQ